MPGFCIVFVVWTVFIPSLDVYEPREQYIEEWQTQAVASMPMSSPSFKAFTFRIEFIIAFFRMLENSFTS